ncbi:MAG: hypothetical protein AB8C95_16210 [Phycisphaeraceae bacterium]
MLTPHRYLLTALLFIFLGLSVSAQYGPDNPPQPGQGDNPANAGQQMKVPDYIKPGFQMTYMGGHYLDTGDSKQAATTGMGFTVFTVLAVTKEKVLLSATNYLTPGGLPINPDGSFDPDTDANAQLSASNSYGITQQTVNSGAAMWMPVDRLKQWKSGGKVKVQKLLRTYQGETVQALTIAYEDDDSGHSSDFHTGNGMKLEYLSGLKNGKRASQMQLLDTKQINSPLVGAKWPDWAKTVKTMNYSGTYTMATVGIDPLVTKISSEVKFTERGDGYAIGKATLNRQGNAAGSSVVMEGPGTMFGYWIHPDILAKLAEGIVEENKITRTKTTYQVQQGNLGKLGVFVHSNTKNTFYAVNAYNLQTGALAYINIHTGDTGITVEFKLEGIASE